MTEMSDTMKFLTEKMDVPGFTKKSDAFQYARSMANNYGEKYLVCVLGGVCLVLAKEDEELLIDVPLECPSYCVSPLPAGITR